MIDSMGIFRTTISVENPTRPGVMMQVENVMADTGGEYTWLPRQPDPGVTPDGKAVHMKARVRYDF